MTLRNSQTAYGVVAKSFHWLIAFLVVVMLVIGIGMAYVPSVWQGFVYNLHKSLGIVVLFVMLARLIWRLASYQPPLPDSLPLSQRWLAWLNHWALYMALLIMPLSGWLMATASGHIPYFFWLFHWSFPLVGLDQQLASWMVSIHYYTAWVLGGLITLHVLAALKHALIEKDGVVQRML